MKRLLVMLTFAVVLLLVAATLLFTLLRQTGQPGSDNLERWVGQQIQTIADWYLHPQLRFDDLDYQYPATVVLKSVRLTAPDPAHPAQSIDVLSADQIVLELAQPPRVGEPLVMQQIILHRPTLRMIALGDGSAKLIGFSNLVKSQAPQAAVEPPRNVQLSEVFQMRLLQLIDGVIVYDPRRPDRPAMELDQINTRMDLEKAGDGWYAFHANLARDPVMRMTVGGRINLDSLSTDQLALNLTADLTPGQHQYLPPQLQKFLADHEVTGTLTAKLTGAAPLSDWRAGRFRADLTLNQGNLTVGEYRIPIDNLTLAAAMSDRKAILESLLLKALRGQANLAGLIELDDPLQGNLTFAAANLMLEDTLRKGKPEDQPKYGGRLSAEIALQAPFAVVAAKLHPATQPADSTPLPAQWGRGVIRVDEGRLVNLPIMQTMGAAIGKARRAAGGEELAKPTDRVDSRLLFSRDNVLVEHLEVIGPWFIVRGQGEINLDQRLNLKLRGGPLDKVGNLFGQTVAGAVSKVSDLLASYQITGTLTQPQVQVEVAGEKAAGKVGQGAKKAADAVRGLFE